MSTATFTHADLAPHLYGRFTLVGGSYKFHGQSSSLRVRVKGTDAVLSNYAGSPTFLQVSVDGAAQAELADANVLAGASDGWHDVLLVLHPGFQDGFSLSATAVVLTVTGSDPQVGPWLDAGPVDYVGAPAHGQSSFKPDAFADYSYNYTAPLAGRSGLHVAMFRFRAKTDRISVWLVGSTSSVTLAWEIDGVRQGQAPLTGAGLTDSDAGWRLVAAGLDGATEHEYAIAVGDCVANSLFDAVMLGPGGVWGTIEPIGYYVQFGDSTTNGGSCEPAAGIPRDRTDSSPAYGIARALNLFPWVCGYDGAAISPDRGFPYYPGDVAVNGYAHAIASLPTTVTPALAGVWLGRNDWGFGDPPGDVQGGYEAILNAVLTDIPGVPVLAYYPPNLVSSDGVLSAPINASIGAAVTAVGNPRVHLIDLSTHAFDFTSGDDASVNESCDATHYLPLGCSAIVAVAAPLVEAAYAGPPASAPTFSPAAGTYSSAQSVTLSSTTPGAVIHYTADGTTPTTSSTLYTAPVSVAATATLKAITAASGYSDSPVATAAYTITTGGGGGGSGGVAVDSEGRVRLAPDGLDDVMVSALLNVPQVLNVIAAMVAAKLSGVPAPAASGTVVVRDVDDTRNVATIAVDGNGNRTSSTLNPA